jgi:pimeloyl-ACP methyl ester carboxylesterase
VTGTVILLHGMEGAPSQMEPLARHLRREGFLTRSVHYASRTTLDVMVRDVATQVRGFGELAGPVHVVGHSMGGLIGRALATLMTNGRRGRLVQIGSPNRGASRLAWIPDLYAVRRRVARGYFELAPESQRLQDLPIPDCEIGIIAGNRTFHPLVSASYVMTAARAFFPAPHEGPNDGCVSVWETELPNMRDHIVVPYAHDFMPRAPEVHQQVEHFLREGEFARLRA